jgi:hypothetical protein
MEPSIDRQRDEIDRAPAFASRAVGGVVEWVIENMELVWVGQDYWALSLVQEEDVVNGLAREDNEN